MEKVRADLKKEGKGFVLQLGEESNSGSLWQNEGQRERSDQVVVFLRWKLANMKFLNICCRSNRAIWLSGRLFLLTYGIRPRVFVVRTRTTIEPKS